MVSTPPLTHTASIFVREHSSPDGSESVRFPTVEFDNEEFDTKRYIGKKVSRTLEDRLDLEATSIGQIGEVRYNRKGVYEIVLN